MPARTVDVEDLPDPLPPVFVLVGDEELFVDRAAGAIAAAARRADPQVVETVLSGDQLAGPELNELLGPSLFGDAKLLTIRNAQDVRAAAQPALVPFLAEATPGAVLVLHHLGGAKGKAVLEAARKAKAVEIGCARLTRPAERADFVRNEVRRAGGRIGADAVEALVDAVGSDLRELAAVAAQLVSDSRAGSSGGAEGTVSLELVRAFHRGKAEVNGFAVADLAVSGRVAPALEALRFALDVGVPQVVIADAMADGVRSLARVAAAGRGDKFGLAKKLGMPPWKVDRTLGQLRGWNESGIRQALRLVADLNADVKGVAVDASYALERAVRGLAAAKHSSAR